MTDERSVMESYDGLASVYAAQRSKRDDEATALASFLSALGPSPRVLDAGCGQGEPVLGRLAAAGPAVGLDFSRSQLALAAERVPEAPTVHGEIGHLPFRKATFDGVTAFHSLIHVPNERDESVLDGFTRVLRPGGRLLLTEGVGEWVGSNPDWLDSGVGMEWEIAGVEARRRQLRAAGFTVVDDWTVGAEDDEERWVVLHARLGE